MSRKHFSWLLGLTMGAAIVIGLLPERTGRESTFDVQPLLPDLAERVNDIDEIQVTGGGDETVATLKRGDAAWTVNEAGGYPADWERLRGLLAALAQARVVEPKTSNPEYFDRLDLRDVADEESGAVRVRLGSGADATAVLVGASASNRDGQYVRREGENRALLIDRALEVPKETRDWLDREIVDIDEADVVEVTITHADGGVVSLIKESADDPDFVLQNIPEGREAQSSWTVNAPGGALEGLRLDDVRQATDIEFESPVQARIITASGLQIDLQLQKVGETHWMKLAAAVRATGEEPAAETAEEPAVEATDEAADDGTPPAARAEEINARTRDWAYAIPQYKYDVLTRDMDDLLKPVPEPAD